jgi:hypothetical protein
MFKIPEFISSVQHPLFGSAGEPLGRLGPAAYADGLAQPRRNARGDGDLPSVRQISLELFQGPSEENSAGVAEMAAYWLFFIASDLAQLAPSQCLIKGQRRQEAIKSFFFNLLYFIFLQAFRLLCPAACPGSPMATATQSMCPAQTRFTGKQSRG